jgi:hypothetical protein
VTQRHVVARFEILVNNERPRATNNKNGPTMTAFEQARLAVWLKVRDEQPRFIEWMSFTEADDYRTVRENIENTVLYERFSTKAVKYARDVDEDMLQSQVPIASGTITLATIDANVKKVLITGEPNMLFPISNMGAILVEVTKVHIEGLARVYPDEPEEVSVVPEVTQEKKRGRGDKKEWHEAAREALWKYCIRQVQDDKKHKTYQPGMYIMVSEQEDHPCKSLPLTFKMLCRSLSVG